MLLVTLGVSTFMDGFLLVSVLSFRDSNRRIGISWKERRLRKRQTRFSEGRVLQIKWKQVGSRRKKKQQLPMLKQAGRKHHSSSDSKQQRPRQAEDKKKKKEKKKDWSSKNAKVRCATKGGEGRGDPGH